MCWGNPKATKIIRDDTKSLDRTKKLKIMQSAQSKRKQGEARFISSSGRTSERRPVLRLTVIADIFWSVLNVLSAFFRTLVSLEETNKFGTKPGDVGARNDARNRSGGSSYGGSRNVRGNVHGIDHNQRPAST